MQSEDLSASGESLCSGLRDFEFFQAVGSKSSDRLYEGIS